MKVKIKKNFQNFFAKGQKRTFLKCPFLDYKKKVSEKN